MKNGQLHQLIKYKQVAVVTYWTIFLLLLF